MAAMRDRSGSEERVDEGMVRVARAEREDTSEPVMVAVFVLVFVLFVVLMQFATTQQHVRCGRRRTDVKSGGGQII